MSKTTTTKKIDNAPLYALAKQYAEAVMEIELGKADETALTEISGDIDIKLQAIAYTINELDALSEGIEELKQKYADKVARCKKRKETLANYALACMRTAHGVEAGKPLPEGVTAKITGPVASIWLQNSPAKAIGTLESLIAEEAEMEPGEVHPYIRVRKEANVEAIKAALARGEKVGDWTLAQDNHLRIK